MDQSFFSRAERLLGRDRPAAIGHDMLLASLAAHQSASRTALEEARAGQADSALPGCAEPLPELILGRRGWREAVAAQGGCFNRSIAKQPVNGS